MIKQQLVLQKNVALSAANYGNLSAGKMMLQLMHTINIWVQ
jgi:hypothetical protein